MTDNRTTELLKKLLFDVRRLEYETDKPGSDMTLGDYEREEARLIEECVQAVAATLGADDGSRWYELFGTPERAEKTLDRICLRCNDDCDNCSMFKLFGEAYGESNTLEWLRGKAVKR